MYANRLILVLSITAFLISPLLVNWYAEKQEVWYQPFFAWLVIIAISFWMMRSKDLNESSVDSSGSTSLVAEIWVDNWFEMYVNGQKVLEDSTPYKTERSFNAERVSFKSDLPATFAFEFRD